MTELKPCPFCDGPAAIWMKQRVICNRCCAEGPDTGEDDETLADRITAWNTRAAPRTDGDDGELVKTLLTLAGMNSRVDSVAMRQAAARITALSAEVERLKASAKNNNQLARMYKAQADEFRAKYVAAVGQD
jgi:uncharacterized small protein (DUF1192 family)